MFKYLDHVLEVVGLNREMTFGEAKKSLQDKYGETIDDFDDLMVTIGSHTEVS